MVGFFDSGIGGTCILEAFKALCPDESTVYIADTVHCPYGNRPLDEIRAISEQNVKRLISEYGVKMVVVACNTATAAAIDSLRLEYPEMPFVGIEPAIKPAALESKTGVVGVLATAGTFSGRLYRETKAKFAKDVTLIASVADEFVALAERIWRGQEEPLSPSTLEIVHRRLEPLLAAGADRIVLGCTHFPLLKAPIEAVARGRASIVDPASSVARQARRLLESRSLLAPKGTRALHIFLENKPPS